MIPDWSPWVWIVLATGYFVVLILAFALAKTAGDADEQAARMFADQCPDEVEP